MFSPNTLLQSWLLPPICNIQVLSHLVVLSMLHISPQLVISWWYHQSSSIMDIPIFIIFKQKGSEHHLSSLLLPRDSWASMSPSHFWFWCPASAEFSIFGLGLPLYVCSFFSVPHHPLLNTFDLSTPQTTNDHSNIKTFEYFQSLPKSLWPLLSSYFSPHLFFSLPWFP